MVIVIMIMLTYHGRLSEWSTALRKVITGAYGSVSRTASLSAGLDLQLLDLFKNQKPGLLPASSGSSSGNPLWQFGEAWPTSRAASAWFPISLRRESPGVAAASSSSRGRLRSSDVQSWSSSPPTSTSGPTLLSSSSTWLTL